MKKLALVMIFLLSQMSLASEEMLSPKVTLRTGTGSFVNVGEQAGSTSGGGGLNVQYLHYLTPYITIGAGYSAQFDLSEGGVPISGYELLGRYYFKGEGTHIMTKDSWGSLDVQSAWAPYVLALYGLRHYYLGLDYDTTDPTKQMEGEYSILNLGGGADYRLNRKFELNAELQYSLFAFTSTDSRVKIKEMVLWFGVNYVF